jgi:hypothetical protein
MDALAHFPSVAFRPKWSIRTLMVVIAILAPPLAWNAERKKAEARTTRIYETLDANLRALNQALAKGYRNCHGPSQVLLDKMRSGEFGYFEYEENQGCEPE